jgi:hypothetical protein
MSLPDTLYWDATLSAHPADSDPAGADPEIRTLVDAINATSWLETIQSCAGHPERPALAAPEVWVLLRNPQPDFVRFYKWIERATRMRQGRSVNKTDRLIDVYFLGWYHFGAYFAVCGRYIDADENALIRACLLDALR